MNDNKNHIEVMQAIARLDTRQAVLETKVDELVRRVGVQNGRVADSESAIRKIVGESDYQRGESKGISKLWKIIVTILTLAIAVLSYVAYQAANFPGKG